MAEEEILFEISREDPDQTEFVIAATMDNLITEGKKKYSLKIVYNLHFIVTTFLKITVFVFISRSESP